MIKRLIALAAPLALIATPAAAVPIDLSGLANGSSGTLITAPGASFAQTFSGQTVAGTGITGTPTGPLTLAPAGTIFVQFADPLVSPASNTLGSLPNFNSPLSILLDTLANSFTFTMGSSTAGSTIDVRAFDAFGVLTGSTQIVMGTNYNIYTLNTLGNFRGLTFFNNNDPGGVRFQNMSYNAVGGAVPEPTTWLMLMIGFAYIGLQIRRGRGAVAAQQTA